MPEPQPKIRLVQRRDPDLYEAVQYDGTDESRLSIFAWASPRILLRGEYIYLVGKDINLHIRPTDWLLSNRNDRYMRLSNNIFENEWEFSPSKTIKSWEVGLSRSDVPGFLANLDRRNPRRAGG